MLSRVTKEKTNERLKVEVERDIPVKALEEEKANRKISKEQIKKSL